MDSGGVIGVVGFPTFGGNRWLVLIKEGRFSTAPYGIAVFQTGHYSTRSCDSLGSERFGKPLFVLGGRLKSAPP